MVGMVSAHDLYQEPLTARAFNLAAPSYDALYRGALAYAENRRVFRALLSTGHLSGSVLDLGCGTGLVLDWCREMVPKSSYKGLDVSERMLTEAHLKHPTYRFGRVNLDTAYELESADSVLMLFAVPSYLRDLGATLALVYKTLPSGGRVAVMPFGLGKTGELGHRFCDEQGQEVTWRRYSAEELRSMLECAGYEQVTVDPLTSRAFYERYAHVESPLHYESVARAYGRDAMQLSLGSDSSALYLLGLGRKP